MLNNNFTEQQIAEANARLAQEAWNHLSTTQCKSVNTKGQCMYTGSGCAFSPALNVDLLSNYALRESAGYFFGDYHTRVNAVIQKYLKDWAKPIDPNFAVRVQNAHDRAPEGSDFLLIFANKLAQACTQYAVPLPAELVQYLEAEGLL